MAPFVYLASIGGLVLVLTMGSTINGSRSWLRLGGMSIQPSEFAKLAVVIGMALLRRRARRGPLAQPGRHASRCSACSRSRACPAALILLQPDLGTMLVLSATVFGVLAVSGAPRRWLALLLARRRRRRRRRGGPAGVLKAYQVDRFLAFTNPDLDPRGAGYNVEQARIAIGNGGLFGQGLFHGSQTRSGFVPEQHTDFVFTVAGEELGLLGAGLLIALLGVVIWRALAIAAPRRRRLRPGRRRRDRLLVRLPGLPEHRDVPGHHAGHRRTPARSCRTAARRCSRACSRSGCCRTSTSAATASPADPLRPAAAPPRHPLTPAGSFGCHGQPLRGRTAMTTAATGPNEAGEYTHAQILTILVGLMMGMFLGALDQTIVSTAIRTIADDLHGLSVQAWVTTAYLITSTITTPIYGKLGDIYGRKKLFMFAISVFIVGSALCSFATSMYMLAAFRAFQGIGAGGLFTLVLAIIGDIVSPRERARYTGYFMAMFGTSSVLGPVDRRLLRRPGGDPRARRLALGLPGQRADRHRRAVRGLPHPARAPRPPRGRIDWWGAVSWSSRWCRC